MARKITLIFLLVYVLQGLRCTVQQHIGTNCATTYQHRLGLPQKDHRSTSVTRADALQPLTEASGCAPRDKLPSRRARIVDVDIKVTYRAFPICHALVTTMAPPCGLVCSAASVAAIEAAIEALCASCNQLCKSSKMFMYQACHGCMENGANTLLKEWPGTCRH